MLLVSLLGLLLNSTLLPLNPTRDWKMLSFDGVPANVVSLEQETMKIEVAKSASPMIHLFPESVQISAIEATGTVQGTLTIPDATTWAEMGDDALLRVGIIEKGEQRLSPLQKLTAPGWIREMQSALGDGGNGITSIHCFHLMPSNTWIGESRANPKSSLFQEEIVASPTEQGSFVLRGTTEKPVEACGIWVLADGDDTGSTFTVSIESISISPVEEK